MRFIFIVILVTSACVTSAQEYVATLPLKSRNLKDLGIHAIGDSVLISLAGYSNSIPFRETFLIDSDKSLKEIDLPGAILTNVVKIADVDSLLHLYYIEESKKTSTLRKLIYNKATGKSEAAQKFVLLDPNIFGAFHTPDLMFLSQKVMTDTLTVYHFKDLEKVSEQKYFILAGVLQDKGERAFISEDNLIIPGQSTAPIKFFLDGNHLTICHDYKYLGVTARKTSVTEIDLETGESSSYVVAEPTAWPFTTYYHKGLLYKVWRRKKEYRLMVYSRDSLIHRTTITEGLAYTDRQSYLRDGKKLSVSSNATVWQALMANGAPPFVTAYADGEGNVLLKIGTQLKTQPSVGMMPFFGFTLANVIISAIGSAISVATHQTEDIDRYFYMRGNPRNGFQYDTAEGFVDRKIDTNEPFSAGKAKALTYKFKHYLKTKNYIYCFYRLKGEDKLQVRRYPK